MQKFLKNVILFSLIFILINLILFFSTVKPALFEKYIYNDENISNYNYLLVSDSHGAYIKNSPNTHGIFNASLVSDNFHDMLLKIKYFTKKMPKDATVFISIDNHQFSEYRDGPGNIDRTMSYVSDHKSLDSAYANTNFYFKKWTKFLPLLNTDLNSTISDYIITKFGSNSSNENILSIENISNQKLEKDAFDRVEYQFKNPDFSQEQLRYFINIIDYCKTNKINLIAVKFPVTKPYWEYIKEYKYDIEEVLKLNQIDLIDLHDLFFDKNEYFIDQDHMNVNGGTLFSERLINEINKKV